MEFKKVIVGTPVRLFLGFLQVAGEVVAIATTGGSGLAAKAAMYTAGKLGDAAADMIEAGMAKNPPPEPEPKIKPSRLAAAAPLPEDFVLLNLKEVPLVHVFLRTELISTELSKDEESFLDENIAEKIFTGLAVGALRSINAVPKMYGNMMKDISYDLISGQAGAKLQRLGNKVSTFWNEVVLDKENTTSAAGRSKEEEKKQKEEEELAANSRANRNKMVLLKEVLNVDPEDMMYQELLASMIAGWDEKDLKEALKFRRFVLARSLEMCLFKHLGAISEETQQAALSGKSIVQAPSTNKSAYISEGNSIEDGKRISERFADARKDTILSGVTEMENTDESYARDVKAGFIFKDEKADLEAEKAAVGRDRQTDIRFKAVESEKPPRKKNPPHNNAVVLTLGELTLHMDLQGPKTDCAKFWGGDDELCKSNSHKNLLSLSIPEDAVCRTYNRNARGVLEELLANNSPQEWSSASDFRPSNNPVITALQTEAHELRDKIKKYRFSTINLSIEKSNNATGSTSNAAQANNSKASSWQYLFFQQAETVRSIREFKQGKFGEQSKAGIRSLQRFAISFFFEEADGKELRQTQKEKKKQKEDRLAAGKGAAPPPSPPEEEEEEQQDDGDPETWRFRFANWILEDKPERASLVTYLRNARNSPVVRARQLLMLQWEKDESLRERGLPFVRVVDGLENGFVFAGDLLIRAARKVEEVFEGCVNAGAPPVNVDHVHIAFRKQSAVFEDCKLPPEKWSSEGLPSDATTAQQRVQHIIDDEFEKIYADLLEINSKVINGQYVNPLWPLVVEYSALEMLKMDYMHEPDDYRVFVAFQHFRANNQANADDPMLAGDEEVSNIVADGNR